MAHTEEPQVKLETQHVVLSRQVGRADHRWLNKGSSARVRVRVTLCGAKNYGPDPRKPYTCCLYGTSYLLGRPKFNSHTKGFIREDMFPNKKPWHPKELEVSSCMLLFVCLHLSAYSLECLVSPALFRLKYS